MVPSAHRSEIRRIVTAGLTVLLLGGATAAAGSGSARVTGLVRLCGGPAPGRCLTQRATVRAIDAAGVVVATQVTTRARFSFSLPPGTYRLVATSGGARGERKVTLVAGRTAHRNIVVPIRAPRIAPTACPPGVPARIPRPA